MCIKDSNTKVLKELLDTVFLNSIHSDLDPTLLTLFL